MFRSFSAVARTIGVLLLLAVLASAGTWPAPPATAAGALPSSPAIGVVSFYSPRPLNSAGGVIPEQFAADDLSTMLGSASRGRFVVIARDRVRQAEGVLKWRDADVLSSTRLGELARRLHADVLITGRITLFALNQEGWGASAKRSYNGSATTVVQVFDSATHRWTWETTQSGHGRGASWSLAAKAVLHNTVMRTVTPLATASAASHHQ